MKKKIMFVCLGNICRSPLAHAVFEHLAAECNDNSYEIESSGTAGYHVGELPDGRMRETAKSHGVNMTHRALQFKKSDLDTYDMIFPMDKENYSAILRLATTEEQAAKVRLFREFDKESSPRAEVPDPYYGGEEGFENVFKIVYRTAANLLHELQRKR